MLRLLCGLLAFVAFFGCAQVQASEFSEIGLTSQYLRELAAETRFYRDQEGIITDRQTGLEWLEGPDEPTSWQMAQKWINSLGNDWRTPTLKELESLYLPDSKRKGLYGDPLCLDEAFQRDAAYSFWSVLRVADTAWIYDFSRGYAHWIDVYFPGRFDRSVAVRQKLRR